MGKQSAAWKEHERQTAKALGGVRSGNRGTSAPDVASSWAVAECKERARLPQWLKGAMKQAEDAAMQYTSPRLALVVLHEKGGRRADDLVMMRRSEFQAWYGDWHGSPDPELSSFGR